MDDSVLEKIVTESALLAENVDFLWHGGEPMLAGKNHFRLAFAVQKRVEFVGKVRNAVQTNATLLSKNWCDFLTRHKVMVSTSIDGPEHLHDINRKTACGKGTHKAVLKGIQSWRSLGNTMGAVVLVTASNVDFPEQVFDAIKDAKLTSCALHFCSQNNDGSVSVVPKTTGTVNFFKKFFDLWLEEDNPNFPVRNFRNIIRVLCGGTTLDCASRKDGCKGFMAITTNGDVFPCHRFVGSNDFCIGNIRDESLSDIYEAALPLYTKMTSLHAECSSCDWKDVCGGGCAFERLAERGSFQEKDPYCTIKKEIFSYVRECVEKYLN